MLLFIYVFYKIAVIYLGFTVLIGRIITGIINWKDCERKWQFPNVWCYPAICLEQPPKTRIFGTVGLGTGI